MTTERNDRYKVLAHVYENTGGNCMVSIFTVYDAHQNRTLYAMVNEECFSVNTVDFIQQEVDYDDSMMLFNLYFTEPTSSEEWLDYRDLMMYCRFEFIKKNCKYFSSRVFLEVEDLPQRLLDQMPAGYEEWLNENSQLIETDGYDIFVDERFTGKTVDSTVEEAQRTELIEALREFSNAYNRLLTVWTDTTLFDLNRLVAIKFYPFHKSFDELDVNGWVDDTIMELQP